MEKDTNKEIEDILNETPLENKSNLKTKSPGKKRRFPKKKIIIEIGMIIAILALCFILFYSLQHECEVCNVCEACIQKISMEDIKQQIIDKGYAEIGEGTDILKLSPYN